MGTNRFFDRVKEFHIRSEGKSTLGSGCGGGAQGGCWRADVAIVLRIEILVEENENVENDKRREDNAYLGEEAGINEGQRWVAGSESIWAQ